MIMMEVCEGDYGSNWNNYNVNTPIKFSIKDVFPLEIETNGLIFKKYKLVSKNKKCDMDKVMLNNISFVKNGLIQIYKKNNITFFNNYEFKSKKQIENVMEELDALFVLTMLEE
jgi:hypothetical protein